MDYEKEIIEIKSMLTALLKKVPGDETSSEPFGAYLLRWYQTYKVPKNGVNTSKFMLFYISERINPALGDIPLNKLSGDKIQVFLNGIESSNTRNKIAMIINGSLTKAIKLRLITYNPFGAVELKSHRAKHYRPLMLAGQNKLNGYLKNHLYIAILNILLCTGMRIGEFLALRRECIDMEERLISIYRTVDIRSGELQNRTKTYTSMRRIPYLKSLIPFLDEVFDYIDKKGCISYNQVKLHFQRAFETLDMKGLVLHSFRHTFGCMCYKSGISDKLIQRLMGHASLDVTMNIYVDVLGAGRSPFTEYFDGLKNDLQKRPTDFWVYNFT